MTKLGETDDFKASDFVREVIRYLGGPHLDWALINTQAVSEEVQDAYQNEAAKPVEADLKVTQHLVPGVFGSFLGNNQVPLKHKAERIAEAALSIARLGRVQGLRVDGVHASTPTMAQEIPAGIGSNGKGGLLGD